MDAGGQRWLKGLACKPEAPYGQVAADALAQSTPIDLRAGKDIAVLKADPAQKAGQSQVLTTEFQLESPQDIDRLFLAYQMAKALKVSLNGTRIMDLPKIDRPDARPTNLMLKPVTRELLAKGSNTLMVEFTPGGPGGQVALKRGQ